MKTNKLISTLILLCAALIITGNITLGQKESVVLEDPLYGTWVNPDYNTRYYWAKITIRPDGTFTYCNNTEFTEGRHGTFNVVNSWMDSEGNIYYQMKVFAGTIGEEEFHELWKINRAS